MRLVMTRVWVWTVGGGWGFWYPFIKSGLSVVSPGFKVSHIWVSVNVWSERRPRRDRETHSLEHSSIIYFFFFWRTTTASHLWKFINFQQHSFEKCKVTIQIFNRKKKNKLTAELFFFFFRNSTFFFYNTFKCFVIVEQKWWNQVTCFIVW